MTGTTFETPPSFRFEYDPPVLQYGRGRVADLGDELAGQDLGNALVVCGQTVGSTPAVIEPVRAGLGDRLAGVFDETTPEKRLATAVEARAAMAETGADVLVGLGGGSSLDVATVAAVLAGSDRNPREVGQELERTGTITVPEGVPPVVAVPTTLAGADLSMGAGVTADPASGLVEEPTSGGVSDPALMPAAVFYDPALIETTPWSVLAPSAMNGFDKGIETLYAKTATPITDATAVRGLGQLGDALVTLGENHDESTGETDYDGTALERVVEGIVLVQYGIWRPDAMTLSIIHAFGHGLTRTYPVQQGAAHAVVAPAVLSYVFEQVDGRRDLLAAAFDVSGSDGSTDADDPADAVVEVVADVAAALDLPTRLRDVDGPEPEEFPAVAEAILADSFMSNAPPGLEPTAAEIEAVLRECW